MQFTCVGDCGHEVIYICWAKGNYFQLSLYSCFLLRKMAVNERESIITRSTTNALKEIDICGIIRNICSQMSLHGDIIKSLFNDIMEDIVQEAIQPLRARIESLEEQIELISEKSNDNEQYSRR
jgi:hypothetical protein